MNKTSVIIPFLSFYEFLPLAIESCLSQSVSVDIIVANAGDPQKTAEACAAYPSVRIVNTDGNVIRAINLSLKESLTPYYMLLCADDKLAPSYAEIGEQFLDSNPDCDVVVGDIQTFGSSDYYWASTGLVPEIRQSNTMFYTAVTRKSLWERLGGYSEDIPWLVYEDWDFWARAFAIGAQSHHVTSALYYYRTHPYSVTNTVVATHGGEAVAWMRGKGVIG